MNDDGFIEPRVAGWLNAGPDRAPSRAMDQALSRIAAVPQDRYPAASGRVPWRSSPASTALAALVIAATGVALLATWRPSVNGTPAAGSNSPGPRSTPAVRATTGIVVLPGPSYVPYAGKSEDWLPLIAACLRDKGWDATIEWDGGMSVNVPSGDRSALQADEYACWGVFGGPPSFAPLTEAEIRALYHYWAHDLRDCLIGMGYTISEPPTEQDFIATYPRTEGIVESGPWSPYSDLPENLGPHSWREVNETCPQAPPS
jgi:hypothetical protein